MRHTDTGRAARWIGLVVAALAVALASATRFAPTAHAASITVTTTADEINSDGDCSLREAIRAANLDQAVDACTTGSGADTISLPAGTYALTLTGTGEDAALTGDLDITRELTIVGAGKADTTIDGGGIDRALHILADVHISGVTVTGGNSGADGGGGIRVDGTLTLTSSRVRANTASAGGGILVIGSGNLTLEDSRIFDNIATGSGGGIFIYTSATLINSLVDGNAAQSAGGIFSQGTLTIVNSTISGNSAGGSGGGLVTGGIASLYSATVTNNTAATAGGISIGSAGTLSAKNSIIAGNASSGASPDCAGTLTSQRFNLIGDTGGCTIVGNATGNITGVNAQLGPLQSNGGETLTHKLLAGGPAIDAGNPNGCLDQNNAVLSTDQRGFLRDSTCDIGAYEANSPGAPTRTATATPSSSPTATRSATATSSPTPTRSTTATSSPTATRLCIDCSPPTATNTPTRSATPTATATPANALTATAQASVTPSATRTPGEGPEASPTPTVTSEGFYQIYLPVVYN